MEKSLNSTSWYYGWLSAIGESQCVEDIAKKFEVDRANISRYFPNDLLEKNLLKRDLLKIKDPTDRNRYFLTIFDGYFDLLKKVYPNDKSVEKYYKDKEVWIKFLNSDFFRKKLWNLDAVIEKYHIKGERDPIKKGFLKIPLEFIEAFISYYERMDDALNFLRKSNLTEKDAEKIVNFALSFGIGNPIAEHIAKVVFENFEETKKVIEEFKLKETEAYKVMNTLSTELMKKMIKYASTLLSKFA